MIKKLFLLCLFLSFLVIKSSAQSGDSTSLFTISGYVDAYYAYYTDSIGFGNFQKFSSVSPRSEEFGLNSAVLNFQYNAKKFRGIVIVQLGDIPKSSWSSTFNNIMEAHAGIRFCRNLWLDAGFFRTHFGTEGLLPKENLLSSLSIGTFFEPFYEAGARLNYAPGDKFAISIYGLNGYNIYEETNSKKSLGMLMTIATDEYGSIGYSNYVGDDSPDANGLSKLRFHQNLFLNQEAGHLKMQFGVDYCIQFHSNITHPSQEATMYSGMGSLKYQICKKLAIAARGEIFNDPDGIMSGLIQDNQNKQTGIKCWGVTAGIEVKPTDNSYFRIEGRKLQMDKQQSIFYWKGKNRSDRFEISANVGVSF